MYEERLFCITEYQVWIMITYMASVMLDWVDEIQKKVSFVFNSEIMLFPDSYASSQQFNKKE